MNAAAAIVHQEPLYFGRTIDGEITQGPTAEDFLVKVEAFRNTYGWPAQTTALNAIGYLREAAYDWFHGALKLGEPELHARASQDYAHFRIAFVTAWFKVKSSLDVTADFHKLQQRDAEPVRRFFERCLTECELSQRLFVQAPRPVGALDTPLVALLEAAEAWGQLDAGNAANAALAVLTERAIAMAEQHAAKAISQYVSQLSVKVAINGFRSAKIREICCRMARNDATIPQMLEALQQAESGESRAAPAANRTRATTLPDGKGFVNAAGSADDDDESVAALAARGGGRGGRGGRGGGGGRGGRNDNKKQKQKSGYNAYAPSSSSSSSSSSARAPTGKEDKQCYYCGKLGHFQADCRMAARDKEAQDKANAAKEAGNAIGCSF
jgi:Zinc knuckle